MQIACCPCDHLAPETRNAPRTRLDTTLYALPQTTDVTEQACHGQEQA